MPASLFVGRDTKRLLSGRLQVLDSTLPQTRLNEMPGQVTRWLVFASDVDFLQAPTRRLVQVGMLPLPQPLVQVLLNQDMPKPES